MDTATREIKTRFDGKKLFRNTSGGFLSVATINAKTSAITGRALEADEEIYLNDDEIEETARSHRKRNPFLEQSYAVVDPESGERGLRKVVALSPVYADEDSIELPAGVGNSGSESQAVADSPMGQHLPGEEAGPSVLRHAHEVQVRDAGGD